MRNLFLMKGLGTAKPHQSQNDCVKRLLMNVLADDFCLTLFVSLGIADSQ